MTIKKPIVIIFIITFVLSLSLVFFKEGISFHMQMLIWDINERMPKKSSPTTKEQSVYLGLFKCKTEKLDGEEYDVFEGWTRDTSSWEEDGVLKVRFYNNEIENKYFNIESNGNKVYIIENGKERKVDLKTMNSFSSDELLTYKIYYKVGGADDSKKGKCPGWEGDMVNSYIHKLILQLPERGENEDVLFDSWECPSQHYIQITKDGQPILANQNLKGWCNVKFANDSMYYTLAKCNFLDKSMINSIFVNGNMVCSKFNGDCFFDVYKFYFDTNLVKDSNNNISFNDFYINTREMSEDDVRFTLRNFSSNTYYKTQEKKPLNKYYLQGYNSNNSFCGFYWDDIIIDITDNIKKNTALQYLINKIEKSQAQSWKSTGIIEEEYIPISLDAKGTLYCGQMENFMDKYTLYDCVLKPTEIDVHSVNY